MKLLLIGGWEISCPDVLPASDVGLASLWSVLVVDGGWRVIFGLEDLGIIESSEVGYGSW
jgi:hypothetical protein